jgi:hypothetical protein
MTLQAACSAAARRTEQVNDPTLIEKIPGQFCKRFQHPIRLLGRQASSIIGAGRDDPDRHTGSPGRFDIDYHIAHVQGSFRWHRKP